MKLCQITIKNVIIRVLYQNYSEQIENKHLPYYNAEDLAILLKCQPHELIKNCDDVITTDEGAFISTSDFTKNILKLDMPHQDVMYVFGVLTGIIQGITICIATHDTSVKF